ncbi:DUF1192 domain-containing protein [Chelatococcus sambhunathii]|uniref:DUF1192 domain-containing protein n=1 Tax=Chelatococcus sambhunathii TaxID=363953 RepID=A0ABU1DGA0_9HYPH|nr:DUF1192 domain-containing protein [Chelatococcus sambhunathii]MDR4307140.1 DUF1192 domain-containing protein [Chelatococcus sambhunathii]
MASFDDEPGAPPARKLVHQIGQDLSRVSVEELRERVSLLKAEIERVEAEISSKSAQRQAADMLFKR